jgi:hypothetical protein
VREVVPSAGEDRHSASEARDDDQGRVQERKARDHPGTHHRSEPEVLARGTAHRRGGNQEPEKHAPAVAKEDPGRSAEVGSQEARQRAGNGENERRKRRVLVQEGEPANAGGCDRSGR